MKLQAKEMYLITLGGRIRCLRCLAQGKRSKLQCGRPAMKASSGQKCRLHGGASTGARTQEGRARSATARLVHGNYSAAAKRQQSIDLARLRSLEDALYVLAMTDAPKTRGRKPAQYRPIRTEEEVRQLMEEESATPM